MTNALTITIEVEDTLGAHWSNDQGDPLDCPIGRALARQYPGAAFIVSDTKVFTFVEGVPGPVYELPEDAQRLLAVFDAYKAGDTCPAHMEALVAPVTVTLEPAKLEYVPFMRRDKWKSVHNSKN